MKHNRGEEIKTTLTLTLTHRLPDLADDQDDLDDDVFEQLDESIELEPVDNDPGQRAQSSTRRSSRQRFELKGNLGFEEKRDRLKIIRYRRYTNSVRNGTFTESR